MAAAVEVSELVKTFKETTALAGVDLAVPEGTVLGLLGPNGAGKTTVVRILSTLLKADSGRATVFGHDVLTHPDAVRSIIGLTGQYAAVDEYLTGSENLEMVGRLLPARQGRRPRTGGEPTGAVRPLGRRGPDREDILRRHAAAAGHRGLADRPPAGALP